MWPPYFLLAKDLPRGLTENLMVQEKWARTRSETPPSSGPPGGWVPEQPRVGSKFKVYAVNAFKPSCAEYVEGFDRSAPFKTFKNFSHFMPWDPLA